MKSWKIMLFQKSICWWLLKSPRWYSISDVIYISTDVYSHLTKKAMEVINKTTPRKETIIVKTRQKIEVFY